MNEHADAAPIEADEMIAKPAFGRLAASHIGAFLLKRGIRWQMALHLDRVDTIILQAVISANLAHLSAETCSLDLPDDQKRPTSVLSVSMSMGLHYATTRKRMMALRERNILGLTGNRYIASNNPLIYGGRDSLVEQDCAELYSLLDTMRLQGFQSIPSLSHRRSYSHVGRAIIDFAVRSVEGFAEQHGSITTGSIWAAIIAANVHHVLSNKELPGGYADASQPLPDHERRPISLRKLACEVNLPFETVRRHVLSMARRGSVLIGERGIIVPACALTTPQQVARSRLNIAYLRRLFDCAGAASSMACQVSAGQLRNGPSAGYDAERVTESNVAN